VKISDIKCWMTEWLGYIFCEFSFRWFRLFDVPYDDEDWKWYHHVIYSIGERPYALGCYFYGLGGSHEDR